MPMPGVAHQRKMGAHLCATNADHEDFRNPAMTNKQRLIYSLLIALVVLAVMLGLSRLQADGVISEKTFQYIAIAVAVLVVVINGVIRRKVKR
jgi:predicted tellurium resistance membrane protein TerC